MVDPLKDIQDLQDEARKHVMNHAQSLLPLRGNQSFKYFLDTIREDLNATRQRRKNIPQRADAAPEVFACSEVEFYQEALLSRVDDAIAEAQAVQSDIATGEGSPDE